MAGARAGQSTPSALFSGAALSWAAPMNSGCHFARKGSKAILAAFSLAASSLQPPAPWGRGRARRAGNALA